VASCCHFCKLKHRPFRVTGTTPFVAATIHEIIEKNKKCEISFDGDIWKGVSPEAKDLVRLMTMRDSEKRISAEEALKHPWFNKDFRSAEILSSALENMRKYSKEGPKLDKSSFKPELAKMSLLTSSPLLGGRGLDQKDNDSPVVSPCFLPRKKGCTESRVIFLSHSL